MLVNNAGIALPSMSIVDVEATAWRRVLDVNLKSMLFCCQAVVPSMIEARGGRIVNTGSTAARVPRWEIGAYCVSKAAVLHFTRCLAMELAQYGITVNAVGPGATITNLRRNSGVPEAAGSAEARRQAQLKGDMATFRIGVPLGRLGEAQDQANAIAFLASDEASYISGVHLRRRAAIAVLAGTEEPSCRSDSSSRSAPSRERAPSWPRRTRLAAPMP